MSNGDEKEILKKLVINEEDMTMELTNIVERVQGIFRIDGKTGKVIFRNYSILTDKERILATLLSRSIAKRLNISQQDIISITEISIEIERPRTALSGPIKDLVREGHVIKDGKKYRIANNRVYDIFNKYFKDLTHGKADSR